MVRLIMSIFVVLLLPTYLPQACASLCPDESWILFNGFCYKLLEEPKTWYQACEACSNENANLAWFDSPDEERIISQIPRMKHKTVWIGLQDTRENCHWEWSVSRTSPSYNHWFPGTPDNEMGDEFCVVMREDFSFMWDDSSCEKKYSALCKKVV